MGKGDGATDREAAGFLGTSIGRLHDAWTAPRDDRVTSLGKPSADRLGELIVTVVLAEPSRPEDCHRRADVVQGPAAPHQLLEDLEPPVIVEQEIVRPSQQGLFRHGMRHTAHRIVYRTLNFHERCRHRRPQPFSSPDRRRWFFEPGHLLKPSDVSLGAAEGRRNEGLSVIPGDLDTHDSSAQAEDVHVVVFDPLADRIMVVAQTGLDPFYLVGGHGSPDAAAADDDPTVDLAARHDAGERDDVVGVVVVRIELRGTEVPHHVARLAQPCNRPLLHIESTMVGGKCDLHENASRTPMACATGCVWWSLNSQLLGHAAGAAAFTSALAPPA